MAARSDLSVRAASGVAMVAVAGGALWLGGWAWTVFVAVVSLGVLREWVGLVRGFVASPARRGLWHAAGFGYVGLAASVLVILRGSQAGLGALLMVVAGVVATDICAYFAGRTIGGPRIAPRISPSKTWSGLLGGMLGAGLVVLGVSILVELQTNAIAWQAIGQQTGKAPLLLAAQSADLTLVFAGMVMAAVAQAGDFGESWMKRRAGVKDSGPLIPGHGGLFDRADGMLAVLFVLGVVMLAKAMTNP